MSNRLESNDSSRLMSTRHTGSRFARHLENIRRVTTKGSWRYCRIDLIRLESNDSSQLMSTRHSGSRFARYLENIPQVVTKGVADFLKSNEYPNLTHKYVLSSFANRLPVRRIDFTDDESCRPVRIVSIRQHSMPLFNALGRKKVHFNIDNILTMDFRPFHALRTWKVHVVIFSFHTTHFQTLLTPLDFWYVDARLDFRYTMLLIFTHCLPSSTFSMLTHDSTSGVLIRQRP